MRIIYDYRVIASGDREGARVGGKATFPFPRVSCLLFPSSRSPSPLVGMASTIDFGEP